ncbi:hypothetical protein Scep_007273 [Stephania cephalantha]|uniref:Uncharacterized protein n=1 Tax=Stephania cephalantha TaxID=152367 RepID=A0AAP0K9P4_9MAGN
MMALWSTKAQHRRKGKVLESKENGENESRGSVQWRHGGTQGTALRHGSDTVIIIGAQKKCTKRRHSSGAMNYKAQRRGISDNANREENIKLEFYFELNCKVEFLIAIRKYK